MKVHRAAFGDCEELDVTEFDFDAVPRFDMLVAGFPCQPFSSSGNRKGFHHADGHVFTSIVKFVDVVRPPVLLFENVRGLLSNMAGHSMARILQELGKLGYGVEWLIVNTLAFGVPQDRPRLFLLGVDLTRERLRRCVEPQFSLNSNGRTPLRILREMGSSICEFPGPERAGDLREVVAEREPRIGKSARFDQQPFLEAGRAFGDRYESCKARAVWQDFSENSLAAICCPKLNGKIKVSSVRYWGHSGKTRPYFKDAYFSHCIGTNIGAGPTFAVPEENVSSKARRAAVLEFANWNRTEYDHLIFRISAERACLLFDPDPDWLVEAFRRAGVNETKKYVLLGNMVSPVVAEALGALVKDLL